jgi:PAS domain S-box-containing protein
MTRETTRHAVRRAHRHHESVRPHHSAGKVLRRTEPIVINAIEARGGASFRVEPGMMRKMTAPEPGIHDQTYRLLVDAVIDYAIFLLDPEGRVSSWNTGAQHLKGYTSDEAIRQPFSIFFTEEDRCLGTPEAILEVARRVGRAENEGWRVRKDGTRFWALAVLDVVHDDAGRHIGFAKITRDMTKRHEAEQALRTSERRFRLLVQGVTDYAIFMLDPQGVVGEWNTGKAHQGLRG